MAVKRTYYKDRYNSDKVWEAAKLHGAITSASIYAGSSSERGCGLRKNLSRVWESLILKQ